MTFMSENTTRKVDNLGRISIPKSIRDRFLIKPNDEVAFSICYDADKVYVCMNKMEDKETKVNVERIVMELEALGVPVPVELNDMLG